MLVIIWKYWESYEIGCGRWTYSGYTLDNTYVILPTRPTEEGLESSYYFTLTTTSTGTIKYISRFEIQ
jgi:hypothetical protein